MWKQQKLQYIARLFNQKLLLNSQLERVSSKKKHTTMAGVALQRNGFAVIENVLNDKECEAMRKGMWDHAERLMRDNGGLCKG